MRTEHYLFHVLGTTSESRMKFVDTKTMLTLCVLSRCLMSYLYCLVCCLLFKCKV